jgi:hypothetical protein
MFPNAQMPRLVFTVEEPNLIGDLTVAPLTQEAY